VYNDDNDVYGYSIRYSVLLPAGAARELALYPYPSPIPNPTLPPLPALKRRGVRNRCSLGASAATHAHIAHITHVARMVGA
jgi:hypothetical protein